jgi:hypothetical protein
MLCSIKNVEIYRKFWYVKVDDKHVDDVYLVTYLKKQILQQY